MRITAILLNVRRIIDLSRDPLDSGQPGQGEQWAGGLSLVVGGTGEVRGVRSSSPMSLFSIKKLPDAEISSCVLP